MRYHKRILYDVVHLKDDEGNWIANFGSIKTDAEARVDRIIELLNSIDDRTQSMVEPEVNGDG